MKFTKVLKKVLLFVWKWKVAFGAVSFIYVWSLLPGGKEYMEVETMSRGTFYTMLMLLLMWIDMHFKQVNEMYDKNNVINLMEHLDISSPFLHAEFDAFIKAAQAEKKADMELMMSDHEAYYKLSQQRHEEYMKKKE